MAWPSVYARRTLDRTPRSWQLFGIPIHIDTSWFFIVAFLAWSLARHYFPTHYPGLAPPFYWVMGGVAAVLLFTCVLLHELGHSLVAKRYGIPVSCVTLFMFGGVAQIGSNPRRPFVELQIALAGPAVSALIATTTLTIAQVLPVHQLGQLMAVAMLQYLAMINLALLVFNLLPGFPLDGGRVVRAVLWAWTQDLRKATRVASALGSALAVGLFALGLWAIMKGAWTGGIWYMLLGLFLRDAAATSYRQARYQSTASGTGS